MLVVHDEKSRGGGGVANLQRMFFQKIAFWIQFPEEDNHSVRAATAKLIFTIYNFHLHNGFAMSSWGPVEYRQMKYLNFMKKYFRNTENGPLTGFLDLIM